MMEPDLKGQSFCLIRHGETVANRDGRIAGRLDVPLTDLGRQQAARLATRNWPAEMTLFCSPMDRARETTRLAFPNKQPFVLDDLRERDWGIFEGKPLADLPARESLPPEGEGWDAFRHRVGHAILESCALSADRLPIMVCHSGVVRAARILTGQGSVGTRAPNAEPILFRWTEAGHVEEKFCV